MLHITGEVTKIDVVKTGDDQTEQETKEESK